MNVFKLFYHIVVGSMGRLHVYEERTGKYLSYFKRYVSNAKVIVDVGCGAGAFSKALARQERLVIAIDVKRAAKGDRKTRILRRCVRMPTASPSAMAQRTAFSVSHFLSISKARRSVWKSSTEC